MLLMSIALGVLVCLWIVGQVRISRMNERIRKLEREREMWKLAAEHWTQEAERRSR